MHIRAAAIRPSSSSTATRPLRSIPIGYLINRFRKALKLSGTPLRLEFKTGSNPYEGRQNTLTPRQSRKRQRLKSFVKRKVTQVRQRRSCPV